jgi:hypothetical protein
MIATLYDNYAGFFGAGVMVLVFLVGYLLKRWFETRLSAAVNHEYANQHEKTKATIKHQYDVQLDEMRELYDKRKKVELIAELFAEWSSLTKGEKMSKEHCKRLNRLSFESTLWFPENLAREMNKLLQGKQKAKSIYEVLLIARRELGSTESPVPLTVADITYWEAELEAMHHQAEENVPVA